MNNLKLGKTTSLNGAVLEVSELDITKNVLLLLPYGLQMNLPSTPLMAIVGKIESQGDNQFAFVTDPVNRDSLNEGEISIGIPSLQTRLHYLNNGQIELIINGTKGSQTMDYLVKYNELLTAINSLQTALNAHIHTSTDTGSPTTTPTTPFSIDISTSKLDDMLIP